MLGLIKRVMRPACLSALLRHFVCAAVLTSGLLPLAATAVTITNTAQATFTAVAGPVVLSSNTTVQPLKTLATVKFWQYAPGTGGSSLLFDGGLYDDTGAGAFVPLPTPSDLNANPIPLATPVEVRETRVYHINEPIFLTLADGDRNADPLVREFIDVTLSATTGDTEILRLQETGPDTGVFATVIPGTTATAATHDGRLSVLTNTRLTVNYQDPVYLDDTSMSAALVDPFGIVFDSVTGVALDGVVVTLIDTVTGLPAQVFGDDGISSFPATLTTGGTAADSGGVSYTFPPGGFRFPFVRPGSYRFALTPPAGYTAPSTVPAANLPGVPGGGSYAIGAGSYGDVFVVLPGPALNIDIPADPSAQGLFLQKAVSQAEASAGDFLQYRLSLRNLDSVNAVTAVTFTDRLPFGMRYRAGSLHVDGAALPDPAVAADGRTLTFAIGTVAAGAASQVSYVVELGAGVVVGEAVNAAQAMANAGARQSNVAKVAVRIREPLFSGRFTIIGRVFEGDCTTPWSQLKGVANARVMLEDGTYVITDKDGQYHIEGVRPGTHVVQLDVDSLPGELEPVSCIANTRFAGRSFSQFVDVKGGGLWRADFHARPRSGAVGIRMTSHLETAVRMQPGIAPPAKTWTHTLHAEFDSCSAQLKPQGKADLEPLIRELRARSIERIELIGHTDNQRLSARCRTQYQDNHALSKARAKVVGDALVAGVGIAAEKMTFSGQGPDLPIASNASAEGMARNRRTEVVVHLEEAVAAPAPTQVTEVSALTHRIEIDGELGVGNLRVMAQLAPGTRFVPGSARVDGRPVPDPYASDALAIFTLPEPVHAGWQRVLEFEARPATALACAVDGHTVKALASFDTFAQQRAQTPAAVNHLACATVAPDAAPDTVGHEQGEAVTGAATAPVLSHASVRQAVTVAGGATRPLPAAVLEKQRARASIPDDVTASGGNIDWLHGQAPGVAWLFPAEDHNPRAPAARIVIKHAPGQSVVLRNGRNDVVSALNFDGVQVSADRQVAVSVWRGVPLEEGGNTFRAEIQDASGAIVQSLERRLTYANTPVRAELVLEESVLVADGINRPVLAMRLLDRDGKPVRAGVTGPISINAPYTAWEQVEREQQRQLAGLDRFQPQFRVEGDKGIAYVELAPTTESGAVQLEVSFQTGPNSSRRQQLRGWLEPAARDWVVVGFAEGTLGYNTLKDNIQPLQEQGVEEGGYSDGQVSLYAKGRVRGKWLLTMAYDSDKKDQRDRQRSLLSTIDPNEFYTLYGDGTEQRYDAPSQDNLYLKIERGQFYALFGDYDTGLTQTRLARYSRTLNGIKSENGAGPVTFIVFAAETPQNFARDEIQGDGTSGLYRLAQKGIVLNSEQIRLETRDRLHSQKILQSRALARHLDYDIDYSAGTLFFRQPVPSRDTNFNPVFIVAEYETLGIADKQLNAGGRVALNLNDGKAEIGLSALRDENNLGATGLGGVDLKVKLAADAELRLEAASSNGEQGLLSPEGDAWLAEYEHHSGKFDALLYTRRQEAGFGVGQQSGAESGQQKTGADGQLRLDTHWSLQGQVYTQENLGTQDTRDALIGKVQYTTTDGSVSVGAQTVTDKAGSGLLAGQDFRSDQATVAASRWLLKRRLELSAQAEAGIGGDSSSLDFPNRYLFGASYALNDHARLLAGQEFTDGDSFDTSTSRVGLQVMPWQGARLDSTLNQSSMSENGPRTFGQFGLTQAVLLNDKWGLDFSADTSHTFNESGQPAPVINPAHPVTSGGITSAAGLTEDFNAFSAGATYRTDLWSWNGRAETRHGETTERYGVISSFLRQAQAGVAFSTSARAFRTEQASGTDGLLASLDLSWAWRPLGVQWSLLDRLEFRYEDVSNGSGIAGSGLFGTTSLVAGTASTRRIINNLALNRVSREWTEKDRQGNLFNRYERNQWSLYYGAKYALDTFDGEDYSGYTDLLGLEVRHDIKTWLDVGLQASTLNAWESGTHAYSFGPMIGVSPVTNGWVTLGYNYRGFTDRDFDAARYTAQGPYLQLRFKFDQNTFLSSHKEPVRESEARERVR